VVVTSAHMPEGSTQQPTSVNFHVFLEGLEFCDNFSRTEKFIDNFVEASESFFQLTDLGSGNFA